MTEIDAEKAKLLAEKAKLEDELSRIAIRSTQDPAHWETKPTALDTDAADEGEQAFAMQDFEQNAAITTDLEVQLQHVEAALARIESES